MSDTAEEVAKAILLRFYSVFEQLTKTFNNLLNQDENKFTWRNGLSSLSLGDTLKV